MSVRFIEMLALSDRPSSPNTRTFQRSPVSLSTQAFRRSPPATSWNLELLTQAYRCSTVAADPKAVGTFRVDRALEALSLCNQGAIADPPVS